MLNTTLFRSGPRSGILPSLQMLHARIFEASTDAEGVSATALDTLLSNWTTDPATSTAPFPKFIYTVPTGSNPAGTTASDQRKREVLDVIRRHGLLLLEDDPYYFLGFDGLGQDPVTRTRGRSYWSLENEGREQWGTGRVLRFESFSKVSKPLKMPGMPSSGSPTRSPSCSCARLFADSFSRSTSRPLHRSKRLDRRDRPGHC